MIPDEIPRRSPSWGTVERSDHPLKAFRGQEIQKTYWSIGEVAKECGVAQSKIRFYEVQFSLKGKRNHKGQRLYTRPEIDHLKRILAIVGPFKMSFVKWLVNSKRDGYAMDFLEMIAKTAMPRVSSDDSPVEFRIQGDDLKNAP